MATRDDAPLKDKAAAPATVAPPPVGDNRSFAATATCTCADFARDLVCDHVLMAAAVRMVRRMIDAHSEEKPH